MEPLILKHLAKYVGSAFHPESAPIPISKKYQLEHKHRQEITEDTYRAIKLITIKPEDAALYGSFIYKAQPYPGDIDTYESVQVCPKGCTREEANKMAAKILQDLIDRISKIPGVYLGDIKICIDKDIYKMVRQDIWGDIESKNGKLQIFYYDYKECVDDLNDNLKNHIIDQKIYNDIKKLLKPKLSITEWLELMEYIRNLIILRWSKDEVIKGYKIVPGGRKILLEDAVSTCEHANFMPNQKHETSGVSMIKPDYWIKVNDKYLEISDLIMFEFIDEKGKQGDISHFRPSRTEIADSLREDIAKYYYSPLKKHFNPLKYAKRLFSLSLILKDRKVADKLVYLWRSDYNILNQIKAEMETIINMLEKVPNPPMKDLKNQIDQFKPRLVQLLNIEIGKKVFDNITKCVNPKTSAKEMVKILQPMEDEFKKIIAEGTLAYLKKVDLWPAPKKYVNIKYFTTIIS